MLLLLRYQDMKEVITSNTYLTLKIYDKVDKMKERNIKKLKTFHISISKRHCNPSNDRSVFARLKKPRCIFPGINKLSLPVMFGQLLRVPL